MKVLRNVAILLFVTVCLLPFERRATSDERRFVTPPGISDEVRFWKTVFGTYDRSQVIIYDERNLGIIYRVLDFSSVQARKGLTADQKSKLVQEQIQIVIDRIKESLSRLASDIPVESLTEEEKYYQKLFDATLPASDESRATSHEYKSAMERIRVQAGQRSNLMRAIAKSSQYMGDIEAIFESYGLPKELTALIFIESMFNPKALSEVGASGIWQFMPEVGRAYVSMNSFWDSRNDPLGATVGAAELLKDLYDKTHDWALAVNSYHSGLGRLMTAVKKLGTKDISVIIHKSDDPAYGFYSRNYYPEFLAVVEIYKNRADYIGAIESGPIEKYDIVKTRDFVNLSEVSLRFGIGRGVLANLNPALSREVLGGSLPLPPGYPLKVPKGMGYQVAISAGYPPNSINP